MSTATVAPRVMTRRRRGGRPGGRPGVSPAEAARRTLYWPLLLPALVVYVGVLLLPALYGVYVSFTTWSGRGDSPVWTGLANYVRLAQDSLFQRAFLNTLGILVVSGIGVFAVTFAVSAVLREVRWGRAALSLIFFPYLLSPIAVGIALSLLLSPDGLVNASLRSVGLGALAQQWLTPDLIFRVILVGLVWVSAGYYLTLMMSAIGRIPRYYFEAAELDGAGRFTVFRHVTLPMTWDVVTVAAVLWCINAIKVFEFIIGFTGNGDAPPPQARTLTIAQFLTTTGGRNPQYELGLGSAMAVVMVALITVFVIGVRRLMRREALDF
ncbi:carbohydrate ABC transporter permease [Brachybacterium kimchii]|uniref:Sugar ABC transporter permease n=1 Tax=Brachybacterium kimchii TaxID=2942909 RepID=A0ABY4N2Y8_9MICO|nr:sugar ABC transporter permease [Brachybacterium kimchii]UQN28917.1 sugar ABC transporter permease [Brachybacterium kimchii]